jgi:membrane protein implicated in regulation of membrane protease activity
MLLILGIAGLFLLPDPWNVIVVCVAALVEIGEVFFWIKFLRRYRVQTGAEGLLGERAEVIEPCSPRGRVRIRGEIWNARCEDSAAPGDSVTVAAVEGLTLVVEPAGD